MRFVIAGFLGFASVVEWAHFQDMEKRRDPRVVTTALAAVACGYMAAEALTGDWPSW